MSTHPYIPLYVDDYDAATAHLTVEEDGAYSRLIRLCWRTPGCSLPADEAWIARKIRMTADDFARIAKPVLDEFFSLSRGRLVQKRLKREYDDISRKKAARKLAGKKGGEAKALKDKDNQPSIASDLPSDTRAFPEPYPNPEPEIRGTEPPGSIPQSDARPEFERPPPNSRGTRLPPDWAPGFAEIEYAGTKGLDHEEITRVAEDFRDYWIAKPGADGRKADWIATWQRWVRSHIDRRRPMASRPGQPRGGGQGPSDFASIVAERRGYDGS